MKTKNNRTNKVTIRFNDDEKHDLELKATLADMDISAYARQILIEAKLPVHRFDRAMVTQVSKIGVNLNQIARHVNAHKTIDEMALKRIIKVEADLNKLIDNKDNHAS